VLSITERAWLPLSTKHLSQWDNFPFTVQEDMDIKVPKDQNILRMQIMGPNGILCIPDEIQWANSLLEEAFYFQNMMFPRHPYIYFTCRTGSVRHSSTDEWHYDGFSMRYNHLPEQNYIWTNRIGTDWVRSGVQIPKDFDPMVHNLNHEAAYQTIHHDKYRTKPNALYVIDPYILHKTPDDAMDLDDRAFVRISFTPIPINDVNNTPNPDPRLNMPTDGVAFRDSLETYRKVKH